MNGFCPLSSGSKGNALYFGTNSTRILIDAGLSAKMLSAKLNEIGVAIEQIDAVLITHEHGDHIRGLATLASKYQIPIFANSETAKAIYHAMQSSTRVIPKFKIFSTDETFEFGDLEVHPFSIQHDTLDPVGFTIRTQGLKIGICTDLGFATSLVKTHLKNCDYLYVEANHQPSMVHASARPMTYKQRVLSRQGHLSNEDCAELVVEVFHPGLKHIHLAHLSQECNSPDLALETVFSRLQKEGFSVPISIAYQDRVSSPIYFDETAILSI